MIFLHNFYFFDKAGEPLNIKKELNLNVVINDSQGTNAEIIAVTDSNGILIGMHIINGGSHYIDPDITITDKLTGTTYKINTENISLLNGAIRNVTLIDNPHGFSFPYMTWDATMFIDDVPEKLNESGHIFILEKCVDSQNEIIYKRPIFNDSEYIYTRRTELSDDNITSFTIDYNQTTAFITKDESNHEFFDNDVHGFNDNMTHIVTSTQQADAMQFNFMATGFLDQIFESTFEIKLKEFVLGKLFIRAESIMEDETLTSIMSNFGLNISDQEELIFRDSDISEELPNYAMLNLKRKEMLLEHSNIFPYLGSYKALENILKFFDYNDLRVKEYWINTKLSQSEKKRQLEVPGIGNNIKTNNVEIEKLIRDGYKKSKNFGLFFDINKVDGTIDEFGIPNTEDAFLFTIEEILVKLLSLKNYLENKFLPLNAHIIDITGEGIYFERFILSTWSDFTQRYDISSVEEPSFIFKNNEHYIVDTTDYGNTLTPKVLDDNTTIEEVENEFVGNYVKNNKYISGNKTEIGCVLDMKLVPFGVTWDEMNMTWDDLSHNTNIGTANTWGTINNGEFYEMTWEFIYEDPHKFYKKFRGTIKDMQDFSFVVPYAGKYVIKMSLHDQRNLSVARITEITVKQYNPQFISFSNFSTAFSTRKDVENKTWNDLTGTFVSPKLMKNVDMKSLNISWDSLSLTKFIANKPNLDLQKKKFINYVMGHDVVAGKNLTKLSDTVFEYEHNTTQIKINDPVFFTRDGIVIMREVVSSSITNNITTITLNLPVSNNINKEWTVLKEKKDVIFLIINNETLDIKKEMYIQSESLIDTENEWKLKNSIVNRLSYIEVTTPITTKSGEKFIVFRKESNVVNSFSETEISLATGLSNKYILTETPAVIVDADGKEFEIILTKKISGPALNTFSVVWLNRSHTEVGNNPVLHFNVDEFLMKQSFNTQTTPMTIPYDAGVYEFIDEFYTEANGWFIREYKPFQKFGAHIKETQQTTQTNNLAIFIDDCNVITSIIDSKFMISWKDFNINNAEHRSTTSLRSWNDFKNLTWNDLSNHTWSDFSINTGVLARFSIKDVSPAGTIKFNEYPEFQFTSVSSGDTKPDQFSNAVNELNNSDNPAMKLFNFYIVDSNEGFGYKIDAVAKTYSQFMLGYVKFGNGVKGVYDDTSESHTYPIGTMHDWVKTNKYGVNSIDRNNPISSVYFRRGIDTLGEVGWFPQTTGLSPKLTEVVKEKNLIKNNSLNYMNSITPNITWENISANDTHLDIPMGSTCYFVDDNSGIPGKMTRVWTLIKNGNVLIKANSDYFSWFFDEKGNYDVEYEITDKNGNYQKVYKENFISVK